MENGSTSFDSKGFFFFLKCLCVFAISFAGAKYGAAYVGETLAEKNTDSLAQTVQREIDTEPKGAKSFVPYPTNTPVAQAPIATAKPQVYTNDPSTLTWLQLTPKAAWQARDSATSFVFQNKIWTMGGLNGNGKVDANRTIKYWEAPHFNDIWNSEDGITWNLVRDHAEWSPRRSMSVVYFNDKLFMFGGWGTTDGYANDIWQSTDGIHWEQVVQHAAWSPREGQSTEIFDGKIWMFGGVNYDNRETKNDVWYSSDGLHWTQVTTPIPWSSRWDHDTTIFNGKIYLTGGMNLQYDTFNDVWTSDDGATWQLVTQNAPWAPRQGHSLIEYKDTLWTIGRLNDSTDTEINDIWYTRDGRKWNKTKTNPEWTGREDHSLLLFNDKMYIFGGMDSNWTWKNDVWVSSFSTDSNTYSQKSPNQSSSPIQTAIDVSKPEISAEAYIAVHISPDGTSKILTEKNPKTVLPIASITKLMTALIASRIHNNEDVITLPTEAVSGKGLSGLYRAGDSFTYKTILKALLIASHNEMATALAYNTPDFLDSMNNTAASIGLTHTSFTNASGLDPDWDSTQINKSTVSDIYKLLRYIEENQPEILTVTTTKESELIDTKGNFIGIIRSTDKLLSDIELPLDIIGGKTGETPRAQQNLALVTKAPDGGKIYTVLLNSEHSFTDMRNLLRYVKTLVI